MGTIFIPHSDYLEHHGIKGQKWGVRRYQNEDGTLTDAGKRRQARTYQKELNKLEQDQAMRSARTASLGRYNKQLEDKIKRKEFKGRDATKLKLKQQDATKKMTELQKGYTKNQKKLNDLLSKIDADGNYVWRSGYEEYYNIDRSKGIKDFGAQFRNSDTYYGSAQGTRYKVRTATDKRKNSARWNINKDHYANTPIHTEYYYNNDGDSYSKRSYGN